MTETLYVHSFGQQADSKSVTNSPTCESFFFLYFFFLLEDWEEDKESWLQNECWESSVEVDVFSSEKEELFEIVESVSSSKSLLLK